MKTLPTIENVEHVDSNCYRVKFTDLIDRRNIHRIKNAEFVAGRAVRNMAGDLKAAVIITDRYRVGYHEYYTVKIF